MTEKEKKSRKIDNIVRRALRNDEDIANIAKRLGVSKQAVYQRIQRHNLKDAKKPAITKTDRLILERLKEGKTYRAIATEIGRSPHAVSARIKELELNGVEIQRGKRIVRTENDETDNLILAKLESGKNQVQTAKDLGVTVGAVSSRIRRMRERGVVLPVKQQKAKKNPNDPQKETANSTQKDEINQIILKQLLDGKSRAQIARELGFSPSTITSRINKMRELGIEVPGSVVKQPLKMADNEINNAILEMAMAHKTQDEIALSLGLSQSTVSKRIRTMRISGSNIPSGYINKRNVDRDKYVLKRLEECATQKQIAEELNVTSQSVSLRIRNMRDRGILIPESKRRSKGNLVVKTDKKTEDKFLDSPSETQGYDINELILLKLKQNKTREDVAKELGLSLRQVMRRIEAMKKQGTTIPGRARVTPTVLEQLVNGETPTDLSKKELGIRIQRMAKNNPQILAKTLRKLMEDKKATPEQIQTLGECYGFNAEEVLKSLDEIEKG